MFSAKRRIWHMDFLENKTSHLTVTASNPKGEQHESYKALLYFMRASTSGAGAGTKRVRNQLSDMFYF
jgi:Uri superfamily endonuclease